MTDTATVIAVVTGYLGLLFLVALWAERQERRGRRVAGNAFVYSLSLAAYCTTWTFYGSVGSAATSGFLFLGVYLGPTVGAILWWWILRKLVRIKNAHRVTSLADLLSVRYGKSQAVAMLATVALLVGLLPYLALQLKTMIAAVALITGQDGENGRALGLSVGLPIALLMIGFTILLGIRRLSPSERHPGMVVAVAVESAVKLVAFVAVGLYVTYGLYGGFDDVFRQVQASAVAMPELLGRKGNVATFLTHLLLSSSAILFLPRQFHIAVVENSDERHIRTAMWLFPLYMLAITLFVIPVALGGLLLGQPVAAADTFALGLPYRTGAHGLSWLVLLGGFSAGTGMVVLETMTLATMVSNHLLLPAANLWRRLERLRRHLLPARWAAAALIILAALAWERGFAAQDALVSIGLVSFAAVLQLAPALLGGLYWRGASTAGALSGLVAGFATWAYTLVLPIVIRAGWLPQRLLDEGPFGLAALRPEAMFAMGTMDNLTHAVFWSMFFNVGALLVGSSLLPASAQEDDRAERLIDALEAPAPQAEAAGSPAIAQVGPKRIQIVGLLAEYHVQHDAERLADVCLARVGAAPGGDLTALQLATLEADVETSLASTIGTAAAHDALRREPLTSPAEARAVSAAYARILSALKVPPIELQRKINYHRERERLLAHDAESQRFLASVSERLASSLDLDTIGRAAVGLPVPRLAEAALLWLARGPGDGAHVWYADHDPVRQARTRAALGTTLLASPSPPVLARALDTGRTVVDVQAEEGAWPAALLEGMDDPAVATFPLVAGGRVLGTLTLFVPEQSAFRLPEDLRLGEELAHRCASALENAGLYQEASRAEAAYRESESKYRTLVDNLDVGVFRSTPAGEFLQANPAMAEIFGFDGPEALFAVRAQDLYLEPSERETLFADLAREGAVRDRELHMRRRDGTPIWCSTTARAQFDPDGSVAWIDAVVEDVTDRATLQEQLRQSQKMEAIGTLAGGVAHDFNNLLTVISGHANLLQMVLPPQDPNRADVEAVIQSAARAATLTRNLLAFSRKQILSPRPVDLNDIVARLESLLRRLIGEDIEFRTRLAPGPLPIVADAGQIEQVLMNLATNARDAMPRGGVLTIETARATVAGARVGGGEALAPGEYAVVSVSDTGQGMDEATRRRAFEPFFTTKGLGKGTGLGLSMVYGIVKQHSGEIEVESQLGQGTRFEIRLRLVEARVEAARPALAAVPRGGTETILVAEDDPAVRNLMRSVLGRFGYTVLEAIDGDDAIRMFGEHRDQIDLVIVDVVMPRRNGKEVFDEVRRLKPGSRVLFSSGYTAEIIHQKGLLEEELDFIAKPVAPEALLAKVREVLARSGQTRRPDQVTGRAP